MRNMKPTVLVAIAILTANSSGCAMMFSGMAESARRHPRGSRAKSNRSMPKNNNKGKLK